MTEAVKHNGILKSVFAFIRRKAVPWYVVYLFVVIYFATALNIKLISHFYDIALKSDANNLLFLITPPFVLISALSIIFIFFSFKWIYKGIMSFLLITGAAVAYYAYKYGIIFNYEMMVNMLQTNVAEAKSYYSLQAVGVILLLGVLPTIILWPIKIRWPESFLKGLLQRFAIVLGAILVIVGISIPFYQNYASIGRNNNILRLEISPYNYVWYGIKAIRLMYFAPKVEFETLATDSIIDNDGERPEIFVMVLGETARAQNFKFNGYSRNTTPYTDDVKNLIRFSSVKTCGTATAVSVPCMFSTMTKDQYDETRAYNSSNLVDILHYAGYKISWYDNDGGCKGVCKRVPHEIIDAATINDKSKCDGDTCYDTVLLDKLHERMQEAVEKKQSTVIFLHLIGSHGPTYYKRTPDDKKLFSPICDRADIENCSLKQIVNSYDNSIAYTDFILKGVIDELSKYQKDFGTGMFYISDHGESLGEYGLFLHGSPYAIAPDSQTHVPMMTWFSQSFVDDHKLNMKCLAKRATSDSFSQDYFFHSMLGILDVNTNIYDEKYDVFNPCRVWVKSSKKALQLKRETRDGIEMLAKLPSKLDS